MNASRARRLFLLYCPGQEFVVPYLERQLGEGWEVVTRLDQGADAERAVMLSSTDIYEAREGLNISETDAVDAESPWHAHEKMFEGFCRQRSLRPTILRCANTVGTGMSGLPMDMAKGIHRGTLRHIAAPRERHETRIRKAVGGDITRHVLSTVHAVDVALAADILSRAGRAAEASEVFNLSDNTATGVDELIDALAFRMNNKHVASASRLWARMLNGRRVFAAMNRSLTVNSSKILRVSGITPHVVTDYLRTHVYDENSL